MSTADVRANAGRCVVGIRERYGRGRLGSTRIPHGILGAPMDDADTTFGPATPSPPFRTERLLLRVPERADVPVLHLLFSDAAVMRHIGDGSLPSREQIRLFVDRQISASIGNGLCLLTVVADGGVVLGFTGVQPWAQPWGPRDVLEIGWRLGRAHWGRGYATEAARAAVTWVRRRRADGSGDPRLVAMIDAGNTRSRSVAFKLGMSALAEYVSPHGHAVLEYGEPPAGP
jgi:RimJ/RimL family protein N-acetyltransferase